MFNKLLKALKLQHIHPETIVSDDGEDILYKEKPFVHSVIPNYFTALMIGNGHQWGFNWNAPINDLLPFTPYQYFEAGFHGALMEHHVKLPLPLINTKYKFLPKGIINIPATNMVDLEFINCIQESLYSLNRIGRLNAWLSLKHDDVVLNSLTSANLTTTALKLSIPPDVISSVNQVKFTCDAKVKGEVENYFEIIFKRNDENLWYMANFESTRVGVYVDAFATLMHAWIAMLSDIDYLVNRDATRDYTGAGLTQYTLNNRNKYDISQALMNVAEIIDVGGMSPYSVLTVIRDNNLTLSTYAADFDAARGVYKRIREGTYK